GTYGGQIAITSASMVGPTKTFTIPVNLTVNPNVTVTVTPASLSFTQIPGALTAQQTLTLASTGGTASYTATVTQITGGDWLDINPASGAANGTITVTVKPNPLSPSTTPYQARINLAFPNSATAPITVPVSLTVQSSQGITLTPQSLTFALQAGGTP